MNVLETLKIKDATVLDLKDGDILFIKLDRDASLSEMNDVREGFQNIIKDKGFKEIDLIVGNSISDIKIIRR